ncbi:MAG: glycoside hydrolase family 1 protein [Acetobacteraceae bacterium]|nr:glycoside hydrolase family 1 protein [Acetobacteraceae bacterium]MBV8522203.1 glycoside hydrolase family 1 protein [Acetobacteraceae bacterium]
MTFMFCAGIEGSNPTIDDGTTRRDQYRECGHYARWEEDFDLAQEIGVSHLRYGPPIHTTWLGDESYNWEFADATFGRLRELGIEVIADLCHFGLPDWLGNSFQNEDFPTLFAGYAEAFARRYSWVRLYTPVNEIMICARFSALYGYWNEQLQSERGFVTALKHLTKANMLAMQAILRVRPDALFVQSEDANYFHPEAPDAIPIARRRAEESMIAFDLTFGRPPDASTLLYLMENGLSRQEFEWFMAQRVRRHCIMGLDYYFTSEQRISADGKATPAGDVFGFAELARAYWQRYHIPLLHTETNWPQGPQGDEAVTWLFRQFACAMRLRRSGVPLLGFTWYSLGDQTDWDIVLRDMRGRTFPVGLFDMDRAIRPVGAAYRRLIAEWGPLLNQETDCLRVG